MSAFSLLPREHGAYAQISFPLLTAFGLGATAPSSLLLAASILCMFLAHEPLLIWSGGRGGRAQRENGPAARRRLIALLAIGLPAGLAGLLLAPPVAQMTALLPVALGGALLPLIARRREKTALGELLVAFALSATMVPVATSGGVPPRLALGAAAVWAVVFSLGTLTVRGIIARAKKRAEPGLEPLAAPALSVLVIVVAVAAAATNRAPALAAAALIPTALVALAFALSGVHPRNLRRMGWSLVASNVFVLAALLVGLR